MIQENIKFTFGIITKENCENNLNLIIDSIERQINDYEIILVGNVKIDRKNTKVIPFDESIRKDWITKKKNIISKEAKYDNIVYMHDYIILENDWYEGFCRYGDNFAVCMNRIINMDGTRFRDWTLFPLHLLDRGFNFSNYTNINSLYGFRALLPYDLYERKIKNLMYFSGAYWVAKKKIMLDFPLNENLSWGQGEDVEWSARISNHFDFHMNQLSSVRFLKQKDRIFNELTAQDIETLKMKTL